MTMLRRRGGGKNRARCRPIHAARNNNIRSRRQNCRAKLNCCRRLGADRLGGFEVNDELEFHGLFDRKIRGFSPVEYFRRVKAELTKDRAGIRAIRHQPTCTCRTLCHSQRSAECVILKSILA